MFKTLASYFSYDFVRYALIVGVLISLCAALFGVILVLKRFSFIGDGLSHVAFGALAVASVTGLTNNMLIIMPTTVIAAILLLKTGQHTKIKGDAAIAMISVSALALGYLILNVFSSSANVAGDVCSTLFGSFAILTLSATDTILCLGVSIAVIVFFVLFYNKIFLVTFDEDFAEATGVKTPLYNLLIAIFTAIIIALAMNLVGSLLISALIIFPALSAMRVCKSFKGVIITSGLLSVIATTVGILAAILLSTPVGATIVATDLLAFLLFFIVGKIIKA
ncbi:MAG: metal ABC transporter permease [Clostridia bacterium]|nr:metal ABC transporter permease [Clostridia bacterium]